MQNRDPSPKSVFWGRLRRTIETLLVVGGLAGGGATLGFYAATQIERTAHIAEIDRLQAANKIAMDAVLRQVERATESAATASASAADAAATIGDVADKVDAAASKADKAAKLAAAKAVVAKAPAPPPAAVQPDVVNLEIRRANERIKERQK